MRPFPAWDDARRGSLHAVGAKRACDGVGRRVAWIVASGQRRTGMVPSALRLFRREKVLDVAHCIWMASHGIGAKHAAPFREGTEHGMTRCT